MAGSPRSGRAVAFVDGQNLYYAAKEAFGAARGKPVPSELSRYEYPSFDVRALAESTCSAKGWTLVETRFYTGMPSKDRSPFWHGFWQRKLGAMGKGGAVKVTTRPLKYRPRAFIDPGTGKLTKGSLGQEKGVDVRIALDIVSAALGGGMDVALIFSQDQDLAEAVDEAKSIAAFTRRKLWLASAFPCSDKSPNRWGIRGTETLRIDKETYDQNCDEADYRGLPPVAPPTSP